MNDVEIKELDLAVDDAWKRAVIARVQRIDPSASEAAIRRFFAEMDEARIALDELASNDAPMPVTYSPVWPEARGQ